MMQAEVVVRSLCGCISVGADKGHDRHGLRLGRGAETSTSLRGGFDF